MINSPNAPKPEPGSIQALILGTIRPSLAMSGGDLGWQEKKWLDEIAGDCLPLPDESKYPRQWVEKMCEWAVGKRQEGTPLPLKSLLAAIKKEGNKEAFIAKWKAQNKPKGA